MGDEPRMHVPAPVPPPHTGADFERGDVHRRRGVNDAHPGVDVLDAHLHCLACPHRRRS